MATGTAPTCAPNTSSYHSGCGPRQQRRGLPRLLPARREVALARADFEAWPLDPDIDLAPLAVGRGACRQIPQAVLGANLPRDLVVGLVDLPHAHRKDRGPA